MASTAGEGKIGVELIERKRLLCAECCAELEAAMFPDGSIVRDNCFLFRHGPKTGCSHSNERMTVELSEPFIEAKHFAYEDWSHLPMTLREHRGEDSKRVE